MSRGHVKGKRLDPRYAAVAARAAGWDTLLWQMPALTIAAQSFLLFIALAGDTAPLARVVALILSAGMLLLSAISMAKQRQSSIIDAETLAAFEAEVGFDESEWQYGPSWRDARNRTPIGYPYWEWLRLPPPKRLTRAGEPRRAGTAFHAWIIGFFVLFLVDIGLIVVIVGWPEWLRSAEWPWSGLGVTVPAPMD